MTPESEKVWNEMLARMTPRECAFWAERESLSKHACASANASFSRFKRGNKFRIYWSRAIGLLNNWNKPLVKIKEKLLCRPLGIKSLDKRLLHKDGRL